MDRFRKVYALVRDMKKARAFYEALGWAPRSTEGDLAAYNLNGVAFALYPWDLLAADAQVPPAGQGFHGVPPILAPRPAYRGNSTCSSFVASSSVKGSMK